MSRDVFSFRAFIGPDIGVDRVSAGQRDREKGEGERERRRGGGEIE